ncbi:MAG TPA: amylo-alpha-1,6-glucosidase [Crinalium sp.]|jgi:glycogen debranching enzyme
MMPDVIELDGRSFVPADQSPIPEWPCVTGDRPQPTLTLKDDDLFLITDTLGNISGCIEADKTTSLGLFCQDTRFLSRLELQVDGRSPTLLSSNADRGFALTVLCANPQLNDVPAENVGIQREIVLNGGLFEEITVTNYSTRPVSFELTLSFDADFIDLFEVRGFNRDRRGKLLRLSSAKLQAESHESEHGESESSNGSVPDESAMVAHAPRVVEPNPDELIMAYQGLDNSLVESRIQFQHRPPNHLKGHTAIWQLHLESHETQLLGYRLVMMNNNRSASVVNAPVTLIQAKAAEMMEEKTWCEQATRIRSDNKAFNQVIERAEQDVYLLRQTFGKHRVLSAGVPWFSTLFGRDSIIAASQTLILDPAIARETLTVLAHYQGKTNDDWREEEPGKILHELRLGEMARCQEVPHTPYYGTVDATPLWLMLYAEYYAWTHDRETLDRLWNNALAAMEWIDRNCEETGYLPYSRRSRRGLVNQGWKDSGDCIVDRNGHLAQGAIALCEVQGYVYAAKIRLSEIARMKKRLDLADRWQEEAHDLKVRFNRDFWLPDQGYCALALDGDGKPVDSITSNPGHCLHLGILLPEHARSVAERLQAPDMFNGWGIRTLSSLSPAYNPMGYHIGSVWPHDNGMIAMGLRSLGLVEQALEVAQGLVDMTLQQPYQRPPELFCGYERTGDSSPVKYPVACSPQAWATGTIFQLLQMMVNLVPDAANNYLRIIDPALPESIHRLSLQNLRVGQTLIDLEFERSGSTTACRVTKKRGNLRVVIEA